MTFQSVPEGLKKLRQPKRQHHPSDQERRWLHQLRLILFNTHHHQFLDTKELDEMEFDEPQNHRQWDQRLSRLWHCGLVEKWAFRQAHWKWGKPTGVRWWIWSNQ